MVITADVKKIRHVLYVMSSLLKHHIKKQNKRSGLYNCNENDGQ